MPRFAKSLWKSLTNNFTIFLKIEIKRNQKKFPSEIINKIQSSNKPTIHFIHRYLTTNAGDKACGYYQYFLEEFKNFNCVVHDINRVDLSLISNQDVAIIGGGGLLNALNIWNYNINQIAKIANKTIIWSAGFNSNGNKKLKQQINWSNLDLVAIRDFNYPQNFRYVPCATCVSTEFDKETDIKRNIGLILHEHKKNIPAEFSGYDSIKNSSSANEMIDFIKSSEIIITSSFHAAYWSGLLKKKCIIFSLQSEKFGYLKYSPTLYSGNLKLDIHNSKIYDNILEESRDLVNEYFNDILKLINNM